MVALTFCSYVLLLVKSLTGLIVTVNYPIGTVSDLIRSVSYLIVTVNAQTLMEEFGERKDNFKKG